MMLYVYNWQYMKNLEQTKNQTTFAVLINFASFSIVGLGEFMSLKKL